MFAPNEKVVYPAHGVAKINRILEKKIGNNPTQFFELKFLNKDMTILVPINNSSSVGIRRLSSPESIIDVFKFLAQPATIATCYESATTGNWNKRNKDYQGKLRTGSLLDICSIYRDLQAIALQKELSFGEKSLLQQTEALIAQEISQVNKMEEEQAIEQLRSLFKNKGYSRSTFFSSTL